MLPLDAFLKLKLAAHLGQFPLGVLDLDNESLTASLIRQATVLRLEPRPEG